MTISFVDLNRKYIKRLTFVEQSTAGTIHPKVSRRVVEVTRDLYQAQWEMVRDNKLSYLNWLEALNKFFNDPIILSADKDGVLAILGQRLINHVGLNAHYNELFKNGVESLDTTQLLIEIKMMNKALDMN